MSTTAPSTATSSASAASSVPPMPTSTRSKRSMASDTDLTNEDDDLRLSWSRRWTLGWRILAVNVLTILLVALSTLYLDVFRNRLTKERARQTRIEATTTAQALAHVPMSEWSALLASISKSSGNRLRL